MAVLSKTELAKQIGVLKSTVTIAVKNGSLKCSVKEGKAVIDTKHESNKAQIAKWIDEVSAKNGDTSVKSPGQLREVKVKETPQQKINRQKSEIELEIKREQLESTLLAKRKLQGEMVPTDLIKSIFIILGASFQKTMKVNAENMLNELFHRAKVDKAIAAEFKGKLIDVINESHEAAIQTAKDELLEILKDQSIVKK
jgi:hypothetical protein